MTAPAAHDLHPPREGAMVSAWGEHREALVEQVRARGAAAAALHARAAFVRDESFGAAVFIRAVVEVSSFCRQNCNYCGMRRDNRSLTRYRLDRDVLRRIVLEGLPGAVTDINLQTGEDVVAVREILLPFVRELRAARPEMGISLCLGTLPIDLYDRLREAGADYYVIKLETGNAEHYRDVQAPGTLERRLEAIRYLAATGWSVSSGFILGLPGQTDEHVAETLEVLTQLPLAGCSVSPFIAGEDTAYAGAPAGDLEAALNVVAIMRLARPEWIIPAVSAFNLVGSQQNGYRRALEAGANLATINLTPPRERDQYLLYTRERVIMHEQRVLEAIASSGRHPSPTSMRAWLRRP